MFDLDQLAFAGAEGDPAGAVVLCGPTRAAHLLVGGKHVVKDGEITTISEDAVAIRHRRAAAALSERH